MFHLLVLFLPPSNLSVTLSPRCSPQHLPCCLSPPLHRTHQDNAHQSQTACSAQTQNFHSSGVFLALARTCHVCSYPLHNLMLCPSLQSLAIASAHSARSVRRNTRSLVGRARLTRLTHRLVPSDVCRLPRLRERAPHGRDPYCCHRRVPSSPGRYASSDHRETSSEDGIGAGGLDSMGHDGAVSMC